jgi:hypothetical protein
MNKDNETAGRDTAPPPRNLSLAAERALREAEERRRKAKVEPRPVEVGGRAGPDPVRYGDWENGGLVSDF